MTHEQHLVEWNDEKIGRFWDYYSNCDAFNDTWFTKQAGKAILNFVKRHVIIRGDVLDYGAGKGFLSAILVKYSSVMLSACDFSGQVTAFNNRLLQYSSNYRGCKLIRLFPSEFKDNQFDIVFLVEAIEHLSDAYLYPTISEITRILKPGGKIIVTTRNNEMLDALNVMCPDCGCVFHRVQHMRSFTQRSMKDIMGRFGFKMHYCRGLNISDYGDMSILRKIFINCRNVIDKTRQKPDLIYIAEKT